MQDVMKEIGGFIELEHYHGRMLHDDCVRLNNARNALCLLIRKKQIRSILVPYYICDSVIDGCESEGALVEYYDVGWDFRPRDIELSKHQWLYLVNHFGQHEDAYIRELKRKYDRVILDDVQAYFHRSDAEQVTLYSCRKFFGLPDGGLLKAGDIIADEYPLDVSYDRMEFLLGRYEKDAKSFYRQYVQNNELMGSEPIKRMSKLTENLLRSIDYDEAKRRRERNFIRLHQGLSDLNRLTIRVPEGPFAYPMYIENGPVVRKRLIENKIYVPLLWPNVVEFAPVGSIARDLAANILPLPCDQRYNEADMDYMVDILRKALAEVIR